MAFFFQHRRLCQRVKEQLDAFNDQEKAVRTSDSNPTRRDPTHIGDGDESPISILSEKNRHDVDFPYAELDGISVQEAADGSKYYLVGFETADPQNPRNWPKWVRIRSTLVLVLIGFVVTASSSIDSAVLVEAAMEFHVAEVVEALGGTAMFLVGFGVGSLAAAPASEMLGRYPVYLGSLFLFGMWLIGAALAPNIGAQIVFRGLAGFFASSPLTVAGGTMSDMWNPKDKTWAFPIFAIGGFGGPVLGPVIGSYFGMTPSLGWRWAEWIMLIADGLVILVVVLLQQETLQPQLQLYKAKCFRKLTGDSRFKTAAEASGKSFGEVCKTNFTRPFLLGLEPIIVLFTLYLTVVYIVLFTFLDGYPYIFEMIHHINEGLTNICFTALFVGISLSMITVPLVVHITNKQLARDGDDGTGSKLNQETRLVFSMIGAPLIPIGLFWMGWTSDTSISIWSPLIASVVVGFGVVCIFMSAYMYVIDSYEMYAASALTFMALIRYLAAGGMTVVGVPMYKNLGVHYTLTVLACISAAVVPIPYLLYRFGKKIRAKSKYAVSDH